MSANHSQQLIDAPRFASLTPLIETTLGRGDRRFQRPDPHRWPTHRLHAAPWLCRANPPGHPNRAEIQGLPAFASVAELPQAPDVAIVAVPAPQVLETVRALGRQGARSAIVFSSGFSEVGRGRRGDAGCGGSRCPRVRYASARSECAGRVQQ
ncbi:CoA-binding protein [Pseudomonas aeruginosa]|uniref:CoA-binding protein n=1 Tax=Pseudomonas aeruginosa TaxID=287 RepID=UPI003D2798CF